MIEGAISNIDPTIFWLTIVPPSIALPTDFIFEIIEIEFNLGKEKAISILFGSKGRLKNLNELDIRCGDLTLSDLG